MNRLNTWISKNQDLIFVAALLGIALIIFIPLPTVLIDLLLTINITVSLLIIISITYVRHPLDFSVFPSVLLVTTVFRLALNIATTRLILRNPPTTEAPAGYVVQAFGNFVGGADAVVGFVIFLIITVIQFVVITKGAGRISEVAARFTLDAMPGKQMSIDADLNAGLITEDEARKRRERIMKEADFYGAMDGATKFVRGDAIAGIIITVINILGGFAVGFLRYGLPIEESMKKYTIMTIGDGLVSQIPSLIISLGSGLLVTRSASTEQLGEEFLGQLFKEKKSLIISALFLGLLMVTPLPKLPLMAAGGVLLVIHTQLKKTSEELKKKEQVEHQKEARKPEKVEGLLAIDPVEVEVGYALIKLVDPVQGGVVLDKITRLRRQLASELGIVIPPVRVRDNLALEHNTYIIKVRGIKMAQSKVMPDMIMAMNPGTARKKIPNGIETKDPTFDLDAYWIDVAQKDFAEDNGYTTVDAATVVTTHLSEILKKYAPDILTREDVTNLIKTLKETYPALVDEVINKTVSTGELQKVLKNLLKEGVSIRDLVTIIETLSNISTKAKGDIEIMTEYVRQSLARQITEKCTSDDGKIYAITLEPQVEDLIKNASVHTDQGSYINLPPTTMKKLNETISKVVRDAKMKYSSPTLIVQPQIRAQIKRFIDSFMPNMIVASYNEISPEATVEISGSIHID